VDTDHRNGQLPAHAVCPLPGTDEQLRADAARAFAALNARFRQRFGTRICITDSYRSYRAQARLYGTKPGLAARPGTSNHGFGTALDLCGGAEQESSRAHRWLERNGPQTGWTHPGWARSAGRRPEPWHFEYVGSVHTP
jgi:LAS superfamily LD-carboxypeptidase LdcB